MHLIRKLTANLRSIGPVLGLILACLAGCAAPSAVTGTPSSSAPSEVEDVRLSEEALLDQVILAMLDGEGLYTVAGGLKPVSSGFWSTKFDVATPDLTQIARIHRLLRTIVGLDGLEFGVMVFAKDYEGQRYAHAYVVDRRALSQVVEDHRDVFAPFGIGPHLDADEILAIVERTPRLDRFRMNGILFGYPPEAVEFFVRAAAEEERTGEKVNRSLVHVPTFVAERHRFVWAVPAGHVEGDTERVIRARAMKLLERYRALRARFIGPGKPGAVDLLRATSRLATSRGVPDPILSEK